MNARTRITASLAVVVSLLVVASRGDAADPPYLKLAQALATPKLASSFGPKDKSMLGLDFVRDGESAGHWTRMTAISILKVPEGDTATATRGVIARLKKKLAAIGARVKRFEVAASTPASAYFEFGTKTENDAGLVYSPRPGFVTVAQLEAKSGASISANDAAILRRVAQGNRP